MPQWSFLTNHARAMLCIARDPGLRLRDMAEALGITERSAFAIVADLAEAGYVLKERDGRRNRYSIQLHMPLPDSTDRQRTVGEVLDLLAGTTRRPARGTTRSRRARKIRAREYTENGFFAGQMVRRPRLGSVGLMQTSLKASAPDVVGREVRDADGILDGPMLVAAPSGEPHPATALSKLRVLEAVGRRSLPSLIEATVVPAVVFYVFFTTLGPTPAMLAVLTWSYGAVLRRIIGGHGIPGILQLAVIGLTVRTIVGILSGTFMYFLQPVATTLALALVFFGSLMFGRPMIARMASDFCPLAPEIACRPGVVRLFSGLTLLWAGVHLLSAATTFTLLVSLPTPTFVAVKSLVSLAITISAVVLTVSWSIRTARCRRPRLRARVAVAAAFSSRSWIRPAERSGDARSPARSPSPPRAGRVRRCVASESRTRSKPRRRPRHHLQYWLPAPSS